ncbi:putative E3 ubiquitin-ligase ARI1 isoform X2 isoform A [Micractinium conductrix]|uniref:RBR-type E3 ubiquitin transferase n=1 Tax=Micractinium conductrix TaxID=554055 RepID=A0A2P6VM84_9CHLO|nr:putative E3 ubiquitin-ligase ARI1 isoform X2 isoform A [Micractinium conductrix]|eukprot:PSC75216.1 putative E3 ubiquitin-ligase ARI1 isoform X2 isoform A [Micractinium conductrix]
MGSDDDAWFEDYDTDMSNGSGSGGYPSDSDGGHAGSSSSDDDGDDGFERTQPGALVQSRSRLYTIIDRPSLRRLQEEALHQVQGIMGCSATVARTLLTYFNWDAEAVLGTIAERGQDEVYKRAGLLSQSDEAVGTAAGAPPPGADVACLVCMCDVPAGEATAMGCGHTFCNDCWREHMRINITEGMSRRLKCMAHGCGVVCDEDKVKTLLRGQGPLLQKYEQALLESYVDDNKRVKWCPSVPHCGRAVRSKDLNCEVDCACGHKFCFACCEAQHSPATCDMLGDWSRRMKDGSETSSWLNANTKPCPKCSKPVEKNGGCNLVLCRCGQAFCWLCGQATGRAHTWTNIEGHSCGAYKDEAEARATEAQRNLKRYLHYLTRYEANLQACKLEEKLRKDVEVKVEAMSEADPSLANTYWLSDALAQLFLARKCMAYSYIFAYYMFGQEMFKEDFSQEANAINQALFEDKQGQLEAEVERLSQLIENPWPPAGGDEMLSHRMAIINLAANIDTRVQKMYEVIECDIAPQVASRGVGIAPYKGKHATGSGGEAAAEVYRQAQAGGSGGAGPSNSHMPSSDIIDLTEEEGPRSARKGKAPAGIGALATRSKRKAGS